ncbi:hypothetical protein ACWF94_12870 [Streptomyces sp. NPDC055078]
MHRTTTTVKTLAGMALWAASGLAVTGCVAVEPRPAPPPPPARSQLPAPVVSPQIAQRPARETLERAPGEPASTAPAPPPSAREPARRPKRPQPRTAPHRRAGRPAAPPPAPPRPPAAPPVPVRVPDICALSESHGAWSPDSPQARTCRDAYNGRGGYGGPRTSGGPGVNWP